MNIQTAKSELSAIMHGTTLSQVENIYGVFNRSARQIVADLDPAESKVTAQSFALIYSGVYDYLAPADLKGNRVIDLYPQVSRTLRDKFTQTYNQEFDLYKGVTQANQFTIYDVMGIKLIRVTYINTSRNILINTASDITSQGIWVASGTASNLRVDQQTVDNNAPVLQFDITTGTGYLTNTNTVGIDLTNHLNQSAIFWDVIIPDATKLTSLAIRFGSDSANYWEVPLVTTNLHGAFNNGMNNISINWANATRVGNPVVSSIKYIRLGFTASANMAGVEFAQIWSKLGWWFNLEYYSKYLFRNSITGAWQETVLTDSDIINLDTDSLNIFMKQAAFNCVQQALGEDAGYDTNIFYAGYQADLARYKAKYKSEIIKPQIPYYRKTFRGYNEWVGSSNQIV